jgi:mRNA-degrading endonuclease RelE of RelBE toxin-antitoxin system
VTFAVLFRRSAADFLNALPEKSQRIITEKLAVLKTDPYPGSGGDKERLNTDGMEVFRLHIGRSFTALYIVHTDTDRDWVEITHLMTIEQAHKRYGRL